MAKIDAVITEVVVLTDGPHGRFEREGREHLAPLRHDEAKAVLAALRAKPPAELHWQVDPAVCKPPIHGA